MSEERSSNLSFHVKESIWFDRGQEVDSLVSIALEPDICIQESSDYISIVGSLLLSGEYHAPEVVEEREPIDTYREEPLMRTADRVEEVDDGLYAVEHRFPVDITIPREKVENTDDIYVLVESFDYDVLQQNRLQLVADIEISGLIQEERAEVQVDEVEDEEVEEDTLEEYKDEPVEESEPIEEVTISNDEREEINEEPVPAFELEIRKEPEEELVAQEEIEEPREEPVTIEVKSRPEEESNEALEVVEREEEIEVVEEVVAEEEEYEDELPDEGHLEKVKTHTRDDNALYLTNMLTQENEGFTKVKMRIIQEGDSLDSIAENYAVPVTQILRENRMEHADIEEGQILYIPVTAGKH